MYEIIEQIWMQFYDMIVLNYNVMQNVKLDYDDL